MEQDKNDVRLPQLMRLRHFINHLRWVLDQGDSTKRLDYPLTEQSVVFDCGGYKGEWAEKIIARYNPYIYIFEPVEDYYSSMVNKFQANPKVKIFNVGLSGQMKEQKLALLNNSSSTYRSADNMVTIQLVSLAEFLKETKITTIDLIKVNIEGGEYELLEHLIDQDLIGSIKNIQVQFHSFVPNAFSRKENIQLTFKKTHRLSYSYPLIWENWERK